MALNLTVSLKLNISQLYQVKKKKKKAMYLFYIDRIKRDPLLN